MPTVLVSVRLSPELATMVDRAAEHLECSPSGLVEALLERSKARREDIVKWVPQGPFTEKRNLWLTPDTVNLLAHLAGDTIEASGFIRQVLAYFFSIPEWSRLFGDSGNGHPGARPGTAGRSRTSPRPPIRHVQGQPQGHPLALFVVLLALLLPLLIMAVGALIGWLRRHGDSGTPTAPEDDPGQPSPLSSP